MSLLKWKKLAKQKTELGNKINFVHDTILKNQLGEKISQESFQKAFKPITTKLDEVAFGDLNTPRLTKKRDKKLTVPDYGIALEDEDEGIAPENEKQIVPKPPTYEDVEDDDAFETFDDAFEAFGVDDAFEAFGVDDAFGVGDDQPPGYTTEDEFSANKILDKLELTNYDVIEDKINQPEMTPQKKKIYIDEKLKEAEFRRNQLKGRKTHITKEFNTEKINEEEKTIEHKTIDNERDILNKYIEHYRKKVKTMEGSGLKKRGGNIVFFNDVKQLLKKLELIVGEILAGNTSIKMRNTGVAILDILLKTSQINKAQHEKLYKTYFKV